MRRNPGFTAVAVLSIGLGMGANTAIFTLVNALLLRPLPVRDPGRLVEFLNLYPGDPPINGFSRASYKHFRDHNHVFSGMTGSGPGMLAVRAGHGEPEMLEGEFVLGNFFSFLGIRPAAGRLIGPGDANAQVAVVSWGYWKNEFNLNPGVVGKRITVADVPATIIGVTPRAFFGLQVGARPQVWLPVALRQMTDRGAREELQLIARLKPGATLAQARAEMAVLYRFTVEERSSSSTNPAMRELQVAVYRAGAGLFSELRNRFAKPLEMMMAVVGLLLLIACTNVASMLMARAAARQREMAIRVCLGAGRLRVVRQMLTESLLLAAAGGVLGIFLAYWGALGLVRIMMSGRPMIGLPPHIEISVQPDLRVLLFTAGAVLLTGVTFGLAPAWSAFRSAPASSLHSAGRVGETRSRRLFWKSLVVAQVALTVALLSAAGLFAGHLSDLEHADLGFRRDHVLLVHLDAGHSGYSGAQLALAYQQLLARLGTIPGVRSATLSAGTPVSGAGASRLIRVEGHPERPEDRRYVQFNWVAPKYFATLATPLVAGRDFQPQDEGGPRVAIVNQAMARYYFGAGSPIGGFFKMDGDGHAYQIAGLVGNAKYYEIQEPALRTIYLDTFQFPWVASQLVLRTWVDPEAVAPEVRRMVRDLLKTVTVARVTTLSEQVDASIVPERLMAALAGLFGGLGALLAAIGIYGLLAYTVTRRTNEIGIRMALGATPGRVTRMVLGEALGMAAGGLCLGAPPAYWGRRLAASLIAGLPLRSAFPIVFGAAAMIAVAVAAAYWPAHRAARVEPMAALRQE